MQYELFYLVAGSKENDFEKIKEAVKNIVTEEGGVFGAKETAEKRRLAYKIKCESNGVYVAQRFALEDTDKLRTINRRLNLNPEILRFLLSRADELPELKTREERIKASEQTERRKTVVEVKKVTEKEIEKPKTGKKETQNEDIDKKLEEILNI